MSQGIALHRLVQVEEEDKMVVRDEPGEGEEEEVVGEVDRLCKMKLLARLALHSL